MAKYVKYTGSLALVTSFWALLFAKCFGLEFLVRIYSAPVNTVFYVWCLSIGMATTATMLYLNQNQGTLSFLRSKYSLLPIAAAGLGACGLLTNATSVYRSNFSFALMAIAISGSYFLLMRERDLAYSRIAIVGWIAGGLTLLLTGPPYSLLLISILFFAFSAIPALMLHFHQRDQIERAIRALGED